MDIAPAVNSARPANITTFVLPIVDNPAVSAKGTVKPSERPIMASEMTLGSMRVLPLEPDFDSFSSKPRSVEAWDSRSVDRRDSEEEREDDFDLGRR